MSPLFRERFLRNIGVMDDQGQSAIRSKTIAVAGLGLGGSIFINLVRMGFERFHVADPDTYERTNINRQRLAKESTIGTRKDEALIAEARDINPDVQIKSFPAGVNQGNLPEFLDGVDWVVDVVDCFAMDEKMALNAEARRRGIPVASCGAIGFGATVVLFDKKSPSFAELTGMDPSFSSRENMKRFLRFICPKIPDYAEAQFQRALGGESHIPFVVPGVEICAGFAVAQIAGDVLGLGGALRAPYGIYVDSLSLSVEIYEASHRAKRVGFLRVVA